MSRGFPSMTALLGLLAVAGYQNRDKIAEMLRGVGSIRMPRLAPQRPAPRRRNRADWAACSASWATPSAARAPADC